MINRDGVTQNIFFMLSQQRSGCDPDINHLSLKIPHTVSYINAIPQNWYFSSKRGIIKKKHQKSINLESIFECFTIDQARNDIVAQFIYEDQPSSLDSEYHTSKVMVEYLNLKDFTQFIYSRPDKKDGVLQKFESPYGEHNHLIECIWSENVIMLNKKQNVNKLGIRKMDPYEKACTFDGPEFLSSHVPLTSPVQIKSVHQMVDRIQKKMNVISFGKYKVNRLVCYFKNGRDNSILFQFCSAVRIDNYLYSRPEQNNCHSKAQVPVKYQSNFQLPEFVNRTFSLYSSKPKQLKCDIKCLNCEKFVQGWQLVDVPYKIVIDFYDKFNCNTMSHQKGLHRPLLESEKQNQNDRICQLVKQSDAPQDKLGLYVQTQSKLYFQSKEETDQRRIPKIFQIVQHDLTYPQYLSLKTQADFRGKLVQTCNSCYLEFLGEMRLAGKQRIFQKDNQEVIREICDENQEYKEMRRKYEIHRQIALVKESDARYFKKQKSGGGLRQEKSLRVMQEKQATKEQSVSQLNTQMSTQPNLGPASEQNYFQEVGLKNDFENHVQKTIDSFIAKKAKNSFRQHLRPKKHVQSQEGASASTRWLSRHLSSTRDIKSPLRTNPF